MTINQINYFLEIARCGSLIQASQNLHITQPTLSRQMSGVEKELNIQLFFRTNHGVKLTPAGELLYQEWSRTMNMYNDAIDKAKFAFRGLTGKLTIGVLSGLKVDGFLPEFMKHMEEQYPNIQLVLKRLSFVEVTDMLLHGELDMAFSLDVEFETFAGIDAVNIIPYHPAIIVPKGNHLYDKEDLTFADFEHESFAIVNRYECENGVDTIIKVFKAMGDFYPDLYYVDSMDTVNLWIESGQKCALLNNQMQIYDSANVRIIPFTAPDGDRAVQMGYLKSNDNVALKIALNFFQS